jgi:hypothetical protein
MVLCQYRRGAPHEGICNLVEGSGGRKRIFVTAPYEADAGGVLVPVLPDRCVVAEAGETCSVFVDHYRPRKTGPRFAVAVVGCTVHGGPRYTLYPPGHIPYGRQAAVACSPSGSLLRRPACAGTADRRKTGRSWQPLWETTLFGAAIDAADGKLWPSDSPSEDDRRRRTQGRRLGWTGHLLGVHPDVGVRQQEHIARCLQVPTLTLLTAAQHWGSPWTARGEAVLRVLRALPVDGGLLDRTLQAGHVANCWETPHRWDPHRRIWSRSSRPERRAPDFDGGRSSPPTTSPGSQELPMC